jgi:hypothetical protein
VSGQVDPLAEAAALLAASDHADVVAIGAWLGGGAVGSVHEAIGIDRRARAAAAIEERNRLIRALAATMPVQGLADALKRYRGTAWPRDRTKATNPYSAGDRRAFWQILKCRDIELSVRHLRRIVGGHLP